MQILLTIAYDGTDYAGWQRQNNAVAVQEKIEGALSAIIGREVIVRAASRTDAGVHALGQRASFFAPDLRVPLEKLPQVLNGLLPADISVTAALPVPENFNPQFDAKKKTYIYTIQNSPNPLTARYRAFVPQALDISAMQTAAAHFIGLHDFAAFCATGGSAKTTVREIFECEVFKDKVFGDSVRDAWASSPPQGGRPAPEPRQGGNAPLTPSLNPRFTRIRDEVWGDSCIEIYVTGGGFLYNMVRIIAGTLVYVGLGKISPEDVPGIIASKDRARAGKTMPPQGLVLAAVEYDIARA
ncbi:MAG: tRNA pseudouridine synthase A [Defluviitaleaceae bacterium]|nr:tRNA pseudouridine synthase A [Defluviitaleaceae bacterium]